MAAPHEDPLAPSPGEPELAVAPAPAPDPDVGAEAAAWAAVVAAWQDDEAHRAYLARPMDLDGLALAGRRYRAVLAERPGDAVAARYRDEVVKRAMVQGLASMPRTAPPRRVPRWVLVAVVGGGTAVLLTWAVAALYRVLSGSPGALP
jgi:hypothetical protein